MTDQTEQQTTVRLDVEGLDVELVYWEVTHQAMETLSHAVARTRGPLSGVRAGLHATSLEGFGDELVSTGVWNIDSISYFGDQATLKMTEVPDA